MTNTRPILSLLLTALALQGCALDFDTAFDQSGGDGAADATLPDQAADGTSAGEASPPEDVSTADRVESGPDAGNEGAADVVADDTASDVAADVSPDTAPDAPADIAVEPAPDVVADVISEAGPDSAPDAPADVTVDVSCPGNTKLCGGKCVTLDQAEYGCASTACTPCAVPHATASCSASGTCQIASCSQGYGNCNSLQSDGCEASLTSVTNCGACSNPCVLPHSSETCSTGVCGINSCSSGWGNCDNDATDGCETDLKTKTNCGACGQTCDLPNASESCSTGQCSVTTCAYGWGNCDAVQANGCESSLSAAPNCGVCGETCQALPNTKSATCSAGSCQIQSCLPGHGNCDSVGSNGCEVDTTSDVLNCAGCGNVCLPSSAHHTVSCVAGICQTGGCQSGWSDCDSIGTNGCEAYLYSDRKNCGGCGVSCSTGQICAAGQCVGSCAEAGLGCSASPTSSCASNVAVVGQYNGGSRTVCIDAGDSSPFVLALMAYDRADWVLTGEVNRLVAVQVFSMSEGVTCVGAGSAPVAIQVGGSSPADPYNYSGSMGDCPAHTGYTGAVFGVGQSAVCHMNCTVPSFSCLSVNP